MPRPVSDYRDDEGGFSHLRQIVWQAGGPLGHRVDGSLSSHWMMQNHYHEIRESAAFAPRLAPYHATTD